MMVTKKWSGDYYKVISLVESSESNGIQLTKHNPVKIDVFELKQPVN